MGSKSRICEIHAEDIEARNKNRSRLVRISASDIFELYHKSDNWKMRRYRENRATVDSRRIIPEDIGRTVGKL
jgi:hypothetical protein